MLQDPLGQACTPSLSHCFPLFTSLENRVPQGIKTSVVALPCPTLAVPLPCDPAYPTCQRDLVIAQLGKHQAGWLGTCLAPCLLSAPLPLSLSSITDPGVTDPGTWILADPQAQIASPVVSYWRKGFSLILPMAPCFSVPWKPS